MLKSSDKGGNVDIMYNEQYVSMYEKILSNTNWYRPIAPKLIDRFNEQFYDLVDTAFRNGGVTKNT